MRAPFALCFSLLALTGCPGVDPLPDATPPDDASVDARADARADAPADHQRPDVNPDAVTWCELGGDVPGAVVPEGFCLRHFASVRAPRTLAFAPNGDLFVGAPTLFTGGGSVGGPGAVLLYSDDEHLGFGEVHTYAGGIPDVHGIALGDGFLHFTTHRTIFRTPYATGQRAETSGAREDLGMPARFGEGRFTHGLARSAGGVLLASGGQWSSCGGRSAGEISTATRNTLTPLATGFRNPMYLRCHFRDEVCLASELGEDQTTGAREKIVRVRPGTHYGYPCCFTTDLPASGACNDVTAEEHSFPVGDTPFGMDWERGLWREPFRDALVLALHGSFYTRPLWQGARIAYAATDPETHLPTGEWRDLVTGFGPGGSPLERPADIAFAPDGRLFFADDLGNAIYWIAPTTLRRPDR
jgi:glucose/arabinose dehydrogenase